MGKTWHDQQAASRAVCDRPRNDGGTGSGSRVPPKLEAAGEKQLIRGAYHYYNPNINSLLQAENFILTVDLKPGDLPPILDIEKISTIQDVSKLRTGVRRWLEKVEKHYGVKPIIYTGASFYKDYLKGHFDDFPLWVANYNRVRRPLNKTWLFWQFTETGTIDGIRGYVDFNVFHGTIDELKALAIR
jgi:lysozyme